MKKIAIASDHAGYDMKEFLVGHMGALGYEVFDFGCYSEEPCDYPDFAHPLAEAVAKGEFERAVALCGSGAGVSITVNRHRGVRGVLCWGPELAILCRRHNDANVLCLPARFIDNDTARTCVDLFLSTEFEAGRHLSRIQKIDAPAKTATRPAK